MPANIPRSPLVGTLDNKIFQMAENHPGGLRTLKDIRELLSTHEMEALLAKLDDMNIRGVQMWAAYSQLYDCEAVDFIQAIRRKDATMIGFLNNFAPHGDYTHKAVMALEGAKREFLSP